MQYARYFFSIVGMGLGLLLVPGCEADTTDDGDSEGHSDSESGALIGITAAHNEVRDKVNPAAATPLPALTWSPEIAAVAQAYAEKCIWEHSSNDYGENLFASTGSTSRDVVDSWASEGADYDYASNSCASGAVCGHYTQVVWANTLHLGCGMAKCTTGAPWGGGDWEIWVCNYDPPGNWIGEKPY